MAWFTETLGSQLGRGEVENVTAFWQVYYEISLRFPSREITKPGTPRTLAWRHKICDGGGGLIDLKSNI